MNKLFLKEFKHLFSNHYWNVLTGGKGAGKSYQVALYLVIKLLQDTQRNIVIASRYIKTNQDTTFPAIQQCIAVLSNGPIPNLKDNFKFTKQPLKIEYLPTGQVFKFVSFDNIEGTSSITTNDPNTFFDTIWFEELISADDINKAEGDVDSDEIGTNQRNIETMINSVIRFDKRNENHEGAKPQVIFTNNAWLPEYWLIKKYIDRYVPSNVELLQNIGSQEYVDPDAIVPLGLGKGLFVSRTNALINPTGNAQNQQTIRDGGDDMAYAMLLGATQRIGGKFLLPVINNLRHDIPDRVFGQWLGNESYRAMSSGIDLGLSKKGDATTCYLHGSSTGADLFANFKRLYVLDEYYHSNRTQTQRSPRVIAADIVMKHYEWAEKYTEMKEGFVCYIETGDIAFLETLKEMQWLMHDYPTNWLSFVPVKEKYLKQNRVGNRYLFLRELIAKGLLTISPTCTELIRDLPQLPFNPKNQTKRRHTDDTVDGMMYSILPYMQYYKIYNRMN